MMKGSFYMRYIAFDVETPNHLNNRMSAIGITVIDGGIITNEYYSLINPETYFDNFNTALTGINEEAVENEPNFATVWEKIEPIMSSGILVAHYAPFDMKVLKNCLNDYCIDWNEDAKYLCTVNIGKKVLPKMQHNLNKLCDYYNIGLNHHHAGSDSRACAEILLRYINGGTDVEKYIKTYYF